MKTSESEWIFDYESFSGAVSNAEGKGEGAKWPEGLKRGMLPFKRQLDIFLSLSLGIPPMAEL